MLCRVTVLMKKNFLVCLFGVVLLSTRVVAAENYEAVTTSDPNVSLPELRFSLVPLTQEELQVEADAWLELLRAKAVEVSQAEIQSLGGEEPAATGAEEGAGAGGEASSPTLSDLIRERGALSGRADEVIKAFEKKGGDGTAMHAYVDTVAGLSLEVNNAGQTLSRFQDWLLSQDGGIQWGLNLCFFLLTLLLGKIVGRIVSGIVKASFDKAKTGASEMLRDFIVNMSRKLVFFVALVIGLSFIQVEIGPFLAAMGAVGFILGFALQGTLNNFAAGLMILFHRPYDIGHVVSAAGVTGKVESMNMGSTVFKTADNQTVIVPNGSIWGGVITNITGNETRRVDLVFGIGYDDDIEAAEATLKAILEEHPLTLSDPAPVVKLHELADSSVNFICRPWVKTSDYWDVYWDVTRTVKQRFDREKISIPYPQQDVHVHQS